MESTSATSPASPHSPKRSAAQRAADLLIIETNVLKGRSQAEIVELLAGIRPYRVSRSQVSYDVGTLKKDWINAAGEAFSAFQAQALRTLAHVEREAWEQFDRSQAGESNVGNPVYLRTVLEIHDRRSKLLGLYAPERHEISGPDGAPVAIESRVHQMPLDNAAKKALFARYTAMIAEDEAEAATTAGVDPDQI